MGFNILQRSQPKKYLSSFVAGSGVVVFLLSTLCFLFQTPISSKETKQVWNS
jgi:hypothetical protein